MSELKLIPHPIAAQASNDGGKIKVTLHRSAIQTVLEISDEGHRIPESIKNRVFEPDFTTKTSRGTAFYVRIANPMESNT